MCPRECCTKLPEPTLIAGVITVTQDSEGLLVRRATQCGTQDEFAPRHLISGYKIQLLCCSFLPLSSNLPCAIPLQQENKMPHDYQRLESTDRHASSRDQHGHGHSSGLSNRFKSLGLSHRRRSRDSMILFSIEMK